MTKRMTNPVLRSYATAVFLLLAGVFGIDSPAICETVYKSVDAAGNVTYSTDPPAESVETRPVSVLPPPSAAQRQEAERLEQQMQRATERSRKEQNSRRAKRAASEQRAQKKIADANAGLEKAKEIRDSDWQYLGNGRRRLKESYFERVKQAEGRASTTEEDMATVQRDTR